MKKNTFNKKKNKSLLLFIVLTFILGFIMGWVSNKSTISELELEMEALNLDLRSFKEYMVFADTFELNSCEDSFIDYLGKNIYESGVLLEEMEEEGNMNDPAYDLLKQRHNINQVIYYSELKKFKNKCGYDKNVILFFFDGEKPEESTKQGREIGKIRNEKNFVLLPMDYGYTQHIKYFYNYYDIEELPSLIINYDVVFEGFTDKETLLNALK